MPSHDELEAENRRLAARVAELEAELAAKPIIDRASLFNMVNRVPWGVMSVNRAGVVDFANAEFSRWLQVPAPALGVPVGEATAPALFEAIRGALDTAMAGETFETTVSLRDVRSEQRDVRIFVMSRGAGRDGVNGAVVSVYDLTEAQALDRTIRENEARFNRINAVTPSANYIIDFSSGTVAWVAGRTETVYDYSAEELMEGGPNFIRSLIHPDDFPRVAQRLKALSQRPDGDVLEFEVRVRRREGGWRWVLDRAAVFERDGAGRVVKTLSAAIDIDERKRAEERRVLLINELNHRVKNTLAAVQSIARQTLRSDRPAHDTLELFNDRLVALSAAHNILTRENWEGADLGEIVEAGLRPFGAQGRIEISGPPIRVPARMAVALAMALHELATNAAKYGALSSDAGVVSLAWQAQDGRLDLVWRERGGPAVTPPRARGFGSRLLTQGLPAELDGEAELRFEPGGLVCRITAPIQPIPVLELV